MTLENRFMTVSEARDFLKATPARKSEYALHLRIHTHAAEPPYHRCEEEARTYMDLTRKQVLETLERMACGRAYASKIICVGVNPNQISGKTLYWIG